MKAIMITWRHIWIAVCLAIFLGIIIIALKFNWQDTPSSASSMKKMPIYAVNTGEKKIALTFDCAWENSDTAILLEILKKNEVKATLFATGDWCSRFPDDVKAFFAAGHDIENHSYSHPHVASISKDKLIKDTEKCDEIIESLTGIKPSLYRAPYGEYSNSMLITFEEKLFHKVIQWDVDSLDWKGRKSYDIVDSVIKKVRPGSIILFHNDTKNTPAALRQIIPQLKGQGYEFVLVKDLIYQDGYTLDYEGRQVKNAD